MRGHIRVLIVVAIVMSVLFLSGGVHTASFAQDSEINLAQVNLDEQLDHPTFVDTQGNLAFVAGNESDNVVVVDLRTREPVRVIPVTEGTQPHRVTVSENGILAAAGGKFVEVRDVSALIEAAETDADLASVNLATSTFCMFPCGGAATVAKHGTENYSITTLTFRPNENGPGPHLLVGMIDRRVKQGNLLQIDLFDGNELRSGFFEIRDLEKQADELPFIQTVAHVDDPDGMAVYDSGRKAVVVDQNDSRLFKLDLTTSETLSIVTTGIPGLQHPFSFIPHVGDSIDVALSPDASTAYVTNIRSNTVAVVDLRQDQVVDLIPLPGDPGGPFGLDLSSDGRYLATALWGSGDLILIDTGSRSVLHQISTGENPVGAHIAASGQVLVGNSGSDTLSIVEFPELTQ